MSDGTAITVEEVVAWLRDFAAVMAREKDALTALDAAIGDGDHGINMDRGMRAVMEKVDAAAPADVPALMKAVGMALISKVGGAAGPLYGTPALLNTDLVCTGVKPVEGVQGSAGAVIVAEQLPDLDEQAEEDNPWLAELADEETGAEDGRSRFGRRR